MHDFMQSLQMRCPVPGHIGLSRTTSVSAETGDWWLGTGRLLGVQQRATGAGDGELAVAGVLRRDQLFNDRIVVVGARRRPPSVCRGALDERQRAAADEVHLEAKEIVL